ncbi:hypothetical protein CFC21_002177 [Triticum aestivum]|uniref:Hydrophobic seed protein domain-containing protein n=1 Tax=Triticum aestivum TaxID=4565 RepID=A0A3B5Y126_WHEAT|nr:hypothetical protein CFC21_002177 [Triticum aestivum]
MASKAALFVALSLLLSAVAAHSCGSTYCQPPVVVPTPPVVVPPPYHGGGGHGHGHGGQCSINGLADLDAAVCLCTAVRANILGLHLNVPVDISLLLNHCGKTRPSNFICPAH